MNQQGPPAVVIAVLGVTGVGKSSFIKLVSGRDDVVIGDSLFSETKQILSYEFVYNGIQYILLDTPGFSDTNRDDSEIQDQIFTWLKAYSQQGHQLNGVIYLHRISDQRVGGSSLRNVRMFTKLCGKGALTNIILATTFWKRTPPDIGTSREKDLQSNFWSGMLKNGAKYARLDYDRGSAVKVLDLVSVTSKITLDFKAAEKAKETKDKLELQQRFKAEMIELENQKRRDDQRAENTKQERIEKEWKKAEAAKQREERAEEERSNERIRIANEAQIRWETSEKQRLDREAHEDRQRTLRKRQIQKEKRLQKEAEEHRRLDAELKEQRDALEEARKKKEEECTFL